MELLAVLENIKQGTPTYESARIAHISDLVSIFKAKVEDLSTSSNLAYLGTEFARKEERMAECAKLLLSIGDFKGYCEIMMEVG